MNYDWVFQVVRMAADRIQGYRSETFVRCSPFTSLAPSHAFPTTQSKKQVFISLDARRHCSARYVCNLDNLLASRPTIHVGGYCKEYTKGKRHIGVMLDDSWFLR
jgi:hypothetical protein